MRTNVTPDSFYAASTGAKAQGHLAVASSCAGGGILRRCDSLDRGGASAVEFRMELLPVEFAFPRCEYGSRSAVADVVGDGTRFRHELVDAEDKRHADHRNTRNDRQRCGQRDEA